MLNTNLGSTDLNTDTYIDTKYGICEKNEDMDTATTQKYKYIFIF